MIVGLSTLKSFGLRALVGGITLALANCAAVPKVSRLLTLGDDGEVVVSTTQLIGPAKSGSHHASATPAPPLDPASLELVSWNIHKTTGRDWERDLERFARENQLLLLQEVVLSEPVRKLLARQGYSWQMVGAFTLGGLERGVLIASRTAPISGRALCTYEPLFPLAKSALITHYPLSGSKETLAVANLHGINFSLGMGRFRQQLQAVTKELSGHKGPIIFGGDFNTWTGKRYSVLEAETRKLGLVELAFAPDHRRVAFGMHLDRLFVRAFSIRTTSAPEVESSDHNPLLVTLGPVNPKSLSSPGQ